MSRLRKVIIVCLISFAAALVLSCGAFLLYCADYSHANSRALLTVEQSNVAREGADYVAFGDENSQTALIFYPGAKVEYTAYSPLMQSIAQEGYLCIVMKMPLNFAFFDRDAAEKALRDYPNVKRWYLGGHSLGGAMAASYLADTTQDFVGLVLLGSYSASDLSMSDLRVLSLYGTEDLVLNRQRLEEARGNMPEDYTEIVIDGANHADFGDYGAQKDDGDATISTEEQQALAAQAIVDFMQ